MEIMERENGIRRSQRVPQQRKMFSGLQTGEELDMAASTGTETESNRDSTDEAAGTGDEYIDDTVHTGIIRARANHASRVGRTNRSEHAARSGHGKIAHKQPAPHRDQTDKGHGDTGDSLFEALTDRETSVEVHVQDWISRYEKNEGTAMLELINGILRCSGSEQKIEADQIADEDGAADTLWEIQEASKKEIKRDYPIISKTSRYKGFKKEINEFWECLVKEMAQREHLFNRPEFIGQLQIWVVAMSSSTLRSFRHTSTVISLAMVTGFCEVINCLEREEVAANKQYEGEKKKKYINEERMTVIEGKISALEQKIGFVKAAMNDFFDSVFVHRYRDVDPRIRSDCIHALGLWMVKLPSIFFDGTYLRYMGWVLSDISPLTRLEVVKALTKFYSNSEFIAGLRHFTERFKPRLIEMGLCEADPGIRCSSVALLNAVRLCGFLEDDEIDLICTLLFDVDSKIRKKACPFFLSKVDEVFETKVQEINSSVAKQGKNIQNGIMELDKIMWVKYKTIAELLVRLDETADHINSVNKENLVHKKHGSGEYLDIILESKFENRMHLLLMTICPEVEELKNWELLSEYLLYDHMVVSSESGSPKGPKYKFYQVCAPTGKEEVVLLEILYVCVYMDIISPNYDIKSKKRLSLYVEEHEESISRALLEMVPSLLKKYNS